MSVDTIISILCAFGAAVGAYAAIRYDLGKLHERASMAYESARDAHSRIDTIMSK